MKKWMFTGFIIMFSSAVNAQITFGIRAGISYASLTQIIEEQVTYGGRVGFSVAGLMDIPLSRKFSLRPELSFASLGGAYYLEYMAENPIHFRVEQNEYNYYSIQVPIHLAYKIMVNDWRFGVYGGPSVSVSTQIREEKVPDERKFRPFDIGSGMGFYVECRKVFFSIYTYTGFIDRQTRKQANESQLYQNNVTFSFGYWF
ncbi:MAG: PorT family protein [Prevotellaceae bacterium]|jgi:hypothetical protein|nr:PorT family protein [Prevotellaceae bacterium]